MSESATACRSPQADWKRRMLLPRQRVGAGEEMGPWQNEAYQTYRERLMGPDYPCFFGQAGERNGEVFYAFIAQDRESDLTDVMHTFVQHSRDARFSRFSLSVFFEPDPTLRSHSDFVERFWAILRALQRDDARAPIHEQPDTPLWEFSFDGWEMFVVGTSPTYQARRSRNLGLGIVLLFQPRQLFIEPSTGKPISVTARRALHQRMLAFDGIPVHPDIGFYGDPHNREWKQYVLPDDNEPVTGGCPFSFTEDTDSYPRN